MKYIVGHQIDDVDADMARLAALLHRPIQICASYDEKNGSYRLRFILHGCDSDSADWSEDMRSCGMLEAADLIDKCADENVLDQYDGGYDHDSLDVNTPEGANNRMEEYAAFQRALFPHTSFSVRRV